MLVPHSLEDLGDDAILAILGVNGVLKVVEIVWICSETSCIAEFVP